MSKKYLRNSIVPTNYPCHNVPCKRIFQRYWQRRSVHMRQITSYLVSFTSRTHSSLFCLSNLLLVITGMYVWIPLRNMVKIPKLFICFICKPILSIYPSSFCMWSLSCAPLVHLLCLGWIHTPTILFILTILLSFFTSLLPFFHRMTIHEPQASYHPNLWFTQKSHLV